MSKKLTSVTTLVACAPAEVALGAVGEGLTDPRHRVAQDAAVVVLHVDPALVDLDAAGVGADGEPRVAPHVPAIVHAVEQAAVGLLVVLSAGSCVVHADEEEVLGAATHRASSARHPRPCGT